GAAEEVRRRCGHLLVSFDRALADELGATVPSVPVPSRNLMNIVHYTSLPMPDRTRLRAPEGAIHCGLRLLTPVAGKAAADAAPVLVAERATEPAPIKAGEFRGILARELVRQALLLTARDELGLLTRDLTLRETFPPT